MSRSTTSSFMPVLFVGHGNPMLTISDNNYTRRWEKLGQKLPEPRAILMISAHWYLPKLSVTGMHPPRTIHDFYGFPEELFDLEYPAPGNPELAEQVADLLSPDQVKPDKEWGLDHGTWAVLRHLYPHARIPVVQLSLDWRKSAEDHYRLAERLTALRKEGVLIMGSGNIVHNLPKFNWHAPDATPPEWASDFETWNRSKLSSGRRDDLAEYQSLGNIARLSAPSPDHYLPLLYIAALGTALDKVSFPVEGFDGGTMSMLSVLLSPSEGNLMS